jgi:hypothetical protein
MVETRFRKGGIMLSARKALPDTREDASNDGKKAKTTRVQLDLSEKGLKRLTSLKEEIGAPSYAETIREALWVYEGLLEEVNKKHSKIMVEREEEGAKVRYPFRFRSSP